MKGGRKYIGEIILDKDIDNLSRTMKEKLEIEIYKKMWRNEWFIKNIEIRVPGAVQWSFTQYPNNANFIKMKGSRVSVVFYDRNLTKNRGKVRLIWTRMNFKRSMNLDKKMFLGDSLKAVKVSVLPIIKSEK
tara:strand:- start:173 stop:568 length:396 start_codon:yes stop_codon:yes gene_type:complete